VPNQPKKHWLIGVGWKIAKSLEMVIVDRTRVDLQKANFIHLSCDKVTTIDNQS
jgi:hypothetical protein